MSYTTYLTSNITPAMEQLSSTAYHVTETAYNQACATTNKLKELGKRYFTLEYIEQKAKNFAKAKFLPFSNPPGWSEKMIRELEKEKRLRAIGPTIQRQIRDMTREIEVLESQLSCPSTKSMLERKRGSLSSLQKRYENVMAGVETSRTQIIYLENQRRLQIGARFAGYVSMATNMVVPGAGVVAGLAITGATTVAQEQFTAKLPKNEKTTADECKSVRFGTLCTVACSIASLTFSFWALPLIKTTAGELMANVTANLTHQNFST